MITLTALTLVLAMPQEPAGAGFQEASRIYQQVAEDSATGVATMQSRLDTVKRRIEELQHQVEQTNGALVSLERHEMEHTMVIQSAYQGDERARRLSDLRQSVAPKLAVLEENRMILQRDLESAQQDLVPLQIEYDALRAIQPEKPAGEDAAPNVDQRVQRYFRDKAAAIGLPQIEPLPSRWLWARYKLR
jgi:chromosome segregation ATPase